MKAGGWVESHFLDLHVSKDSNIWRASRLNGLWVEHRMVII